MAEHPSAGNPTNVDITSIYVNGTKVVVTVLKVDPSLFNFDMSGIGKVVSSSSDKVPFTSN